MYVCTPSWGYHVNTKIGMTSAVGTTLFFSPKKVQKHGQKEELPTSGPEACTLLNRDSLFVEVPQHRDTKHASVQKPRLHGAETLKWANFSEARP